MMSIPPRLSWRLNASFLPSGDQSGCALPHVLRVIGAAFVPSAFITQISHDPDRWLANAILVPSGESAGQRLGETLFVMRVVWLPSAFAMYSSPPCISLVKATFPLCVKRCVEEDAVAAQTRAAASPSATATRMTFGSGAWPVDAITRLR